MKYTLLSWVMRMIWTFQHPPTNEDIQLVIPQIRSPNSEHQVLSVTFWWPVAHLASWWMAIF